MSFKDFALTPPMGWNSWDCFGSSVTEAELLANAEYMAKNLKEYGWEYVCCDIQWSQPTAFGHHYKNFTELEMDDFSRLIPATNRFPSAKDGKGFKPIADKIHALGLKFGIHIMRGIPRQAVHRNTPIKASGITARDIAHDFSVCPWNTDMYGIDWRKEGAQEYYDSIIELYASWDVDFIKCDDIANTEFKPHDPYSAEKEIEMLRKAIDKSGRKIVLSLSPGPAPIEHAEHLTKHANMWRMTGDFWDDWNKLYNMFERCQKWQPYVSKGNWPDCDMLPLGMLSCHSKEGARPSNFTLDEQITMLSLWSIFRSPLILGGNLPETDEATLKLITNKEVFEMNKTLNSSSLLFKDDNIICWAGNSDQYTYSAIFNTGEEDAELDYEITKLGLNKNTETKELWTKDIIKSDSLNLTLKKHAALLLRQAK